MIFKTILNVMYYNVSSYPHNSQKCSNLKNVAKNHL